MINRRALLRSSLLLTAGCVGGAGAARAFSIEEPAASLQSEYLAARAAACREVNAASDHAVLRARVMALLAGDRLSADERARLEGTVCPLCGCRVASR